MNCHTQVQKDNPKLEPVRASWKNGQPGRVGVDPSHRRLRLLQSRGAREPRHQLFQLPRPGQSYADGVSWPSRTAWRGASNAIGTRKIFCGRKIRFSISIGNRTM